MSSFFKTVEKFFRLPDLRRKFFIVICLVIASRLISSIPIPGVDRSQLVNWVNSNQAFSLLNIFTGGGLLNFSLALMGVGPYITSSIIFQLLVYVIPSLEALNKEGEFGRRKLNQYMRIGAIPLAFIQGFGTLTYLKNTGLINQWTPWHLAFMLILAVGGSMLLMWLGELISEQGIGNGISILITAGIVASFPNQIKNTIDRYSGVTSSQDILQLIGFAVLGLIALAFIIFMNEGKRELPVSYARRVRGSKMYGGVDTSLPIKVNAAGVVPIIFAVSMVMFPNIIGEFLAKAQSAQVKHIGEVIVDFFKNQTYYSIIYFVFVLAFTFFYTFIIFQPKQMAENLQKQGGFIPGIRPGVDTELYLYSVISKLTFVGAIFLGLIAILPNIAQQVTKVQTLSLGGTSLLIVVSVVLEILRQVRAQIITRTYDHYI